MSHNHPVADVFLYDTNISLTADNMAILRMALSCKSRFEIDPDHKAADLYQRLGWIIFVGSSLHLNLEDFLCLHSALKMFLEGIQDTIYIMPFKQQVQKLYDELNNAPCNQTQEE